MSRKFVILFLNCYSVISVILLCNCDHITVTTAMMDQSDTPAEVDHATIFTFNEDTATEPSRGAVDIFSHNSIASLPPSIDEHVSVSETVVEEEPRDANDINNEPAPQVTSEDPLTTTQQPATTTEQAYLPCSIPYSYCFNGGTCVMQNGTPLCLCPDEFFGARCQSRNICKTIIGETNMTGYQICAGIQRDCEYKNDKFFQCSCLENEYFIFKEITAKQKESNRGSPEDRRAAIHRRSETNHISDDAKKQEQVNSNETRQSQSEKRFEAECRQVDKCVHVQCRQSSESCVEGQCVCNTDLGYMKDPADGLCKLLNPCLVPQPSGRPVCGEAECIATYDREQVECFCPIGFNATRKGTDKSTTRCVPTNLICDVPLLNKCQHRCELDPAGKGHRCSCLPGYRAGKRTDGEDHMCFFEEPIDGDEEPLIKERSDRSTSSNYVFRIIIFPKEPPTTPKTVKIPLETITYDPIESTSHTNNHQQHRQVDLPIQPTKYSDAIHSPPQSADFYIQIIPASEVKSDHDARDIDSGSYVPYNNLSTISAQEKCNAYCPTNEICVQSGPRDWYRCECDRQGYVKVGDQCLDWCSAAELNKTIKQHLQIACYSGICESSVRDLPTANNELRSIGRPDFECDCSTSSLLFKDPKTNLCRLDFSKVLDICLPGNAGYEDCVVNKNAYCAVLHKHHTIFEEDLRHGEQDSQLVSEESSLSTAGNYTGSIDKKYVCICSPEKKFVVDVPRVKARCINECDLLKYECVRFNMMCRNATISPDDYGARNLIRNNRDGSLRINFRQTDCECLPGFNVGPEDTTNALDDYRQSYAPSETDASAPANQHDSTAKYMNINSRCTLDYDVVEFQNACFKVPTSFDLAWIPVNNPRLPITYLPELESSISNASTNNIGDDSKRMTDDNGNSRKFKRHTTRKAANPEELILQPPDYMGAGISELPKHVVLVNHCKKYLSSPLSLDAYQACIKYRYWIIQKLRLHFTDWREVMNKHLNETFRYMEGNIKIRINNCTSTIKSLKKTVADTKQDASQERTTYNAMDSDVIIDADMFCDLTLHAADDGYSPRYAQKVLLEKQLQKFIYNVSYHDYYLMAPHMLINRKSIDFLTEHRKTFNPCRSSYNYCDVQTTCRMVDRVNFTCTCSTGYTPIGSRDLYYNDSRKEVCEDINECLFDVCKPIENVSTCINEIGDYKCQCNPDYVGNNKNFCTHACDSIQCNREHGTCEIIAPHTATCVCSPGYQDFDCSKPDPEVARRKATMIIIGSIFASVLLLAITSAISLNLQLKKTKKKIKKLEAASGTSFQLFDLPHQTLRAAG